MQTRTRFPLPWLLLALLVVVGLAYGVRPQPAPAPATGGWVWHHAAADPAEATPDLPAIPDQPAGTLRFKDKKFWESKNIAVHQVKRRIAGAHSSLHDLHLDDNDEVWIKRKGADDSTANYVGTLEELAQDYPLTK
ncbi:MAG: hypothetical protein HC914_17000 [Chloroflexaceae bacterium]|nr:hypothetical protein [Chloroflexaceae bacterium]